MYIKYFSFHAIVGSSWNKCSCLILVYIYFIVCKTVAFYIAFQRHESDTEYMFQSGISERHGSDTECMFQSGISEGNAVLIHVCWWPLS